MFIRLSGVCYNLKSHQRVAYDGNYLPLNIFGELAIIIRVTLIPRAEIGRLCLSYRTF